MTKSTPNILDFEEINKSAISSLRPAWLMKIEFFIILMAGLMAFITIAVIIYSIISSSLLIQLIFPLFIPPSFLFPILYIQIWKNKLSKIHTERSIPSIEIIQLGFVFIIGLVIAIFWAFIGAILMIDIEVNELTIIIKIILAFFTIIHLIEVFFYIRTFIDLRKFKQT